MKNTATSITLVSTRPEESKEKQIEVAKELRTFLKSKKVGLVKQSEGDGPPSIIVFDPDNQFPWAAPLSSKGTTDKSIFAISGSYSAKTWIASKTTPLAPPETEVSGTISVPGLSSTSNLQFVEQLGTEPLGTGTIQLGTTDTTIVDHAVEIMEKSGPEVVNVQQPPIIISLLRNAEIGISGLFIISGMTCKFTKLTTYPRRHNSRNRGCNRDNVHHCWKFTANGRNHHARFRGTRWGSSNLATYYDNIMGYLVEKFSNT